MNPLKEIAQDISGAAALADWLGDGGSPVHPMLAEMRAARCASGENGGLCPLNKEPNWWDRVKHTIADWIRKELELKSGLGLRVDVEEKIHMCSACGCCLRLKVWVPRKHLAAHIDTKILNLTPAYCWLRRELLT